MEKQKLYNQLIVAYTSAHPAKHGKTVQINVAKIWKEMKNINNSELLPNAVKKQIQEWNQKTMKRKSTLLNLWSKVYSFIFVYNVLRMFFGFQIYFE